MRDLRPVGLEESQLAAYLARVGLAHRPSPTAEGLSHIHVAHLRRVPFENLDIHMDRPITLDIGDLFRKIVEEKRGGFCYEQNLLFAAALRTLGFELELVQAQVHAPDGSFGPAFDHMAVTVRLHEGPHLADVGFGECFREPLPMDGRWHSQADGSRYRVVTEDDAFMLEHSINSSDGEESVAIDYRVDSTPRTAAEFLPMCRFHQSSEESPFRRSWMCTLATAKGRMTLKPGWLIESAAGGREERRVRSRDDLEQILRERFGMSALRLPGGFRWAETPR